MFKKHPKKPRNKHLSSLWKKWIVFNRICSQNKWHKKNNQGEDLLSTTYLGTKTYWYLIARSCAPVPVTLTSHTGVKYCLVHADSGARVNAFADPYPVCCLRWQRRDKGGWRPEVDEEFEDEEGNVYSKKTYEDVKRQGLIP